MNLCRRCGQDFGSVAAFDAHRVGTHEQRWSVECEDGRRCLELGEYDEHSLVLNRRDTWSLRQGLEAARKLQGCAENAWGGVR